MVNSIMATKLNRPTVFLGQANCHLYHYAGNNPVRYVDPEGRSESYSDDGYYLGRKDDDLNGIYVYHYDTNLNKLVDIGFLIDIDGSRISEDSFHQTVAMIYGEAEGNDAKENCGMGEVVRNRMEESGLTLLNSLDHRYAGYDARNNNTKKYQEGLSMMKGKKEIGKSEKKSEMLRNAIKGTIHGLRGKESVFSEKPFFWSHGIKRNETIYKKVDTINECDFFTLTTDSWNKNKRYWP